ncbi:MAG: DUF2252 family protein [Myxococcota bacterium]
MLRRCWPVLALRVLPILGLAACATGSGPDALRTAWLVDQLLDDNRIWLTRDPDLLATKYRVMADDPYDYVRGSVAVFLADLGRPATDRPRTSFLTAEGAAAVLLVVDPHPENVGTLLPGEGPGPTVDALDVTLPHPAPLLLEINDFDGAAFGPYLVDVRRALLGLATAVDPVCDRDCRAPILTAWARGYVDEVEAIADAGPTLPPAPPLATWGYVLDRLLVDAAEEGAERQRLREWTEPTSTGLRFRTVPSPRASGEGIVPLRGDERAQLDRLLAAYQRTASAPPGFRVLDRARRYGGGVASLPAIRYVVAWDRGDDGPDDDEMLEIREVVDPPVVPGLMPVVPTTFDSQAARAVAAARALWSRPDADARLAGLSDGAMAFKVLTESSFDQAFDHRKLQDDVRSGRYVPADLEAWGALLGRQLANVHARSVTVDGDPARDAIAADLAGRGDAFVAEGLRDAELDLAQARRDHRLMREALDALGPLLGADRW